MCFALLALGQHPEYPFILAANRDEFTNRPAQVMHEWEDVPGVLAGRDLESMGSWLALNQHDRRLALVTNVRDGSRQTAERSRGLLIRDLVDTDQSMEARLDALTAEQGSYAGFNVLTGIVGEAMYYLSNRIADAPVRLENGLYGLSNAALDTPWPKVLRGKKRLQTLLAKHSEITYEDLFAILADDKKAPDDQLPNTGISLEWERFLSSLFIYGESYRTRCSTIVLMDNHERIYCRERSFKQDGGFVDNTFCF
ncbi:MAG: NRDE family protein [Thiolinea sp.]